MADLSFPYLLLGKRLSQPLREILNRQADIGFPGRVETEPGKDEARRSDFVQMRLADEGKKERDMCLGLLGQGWEAVLLERLFSMRLSPGEPLKWSASVRQPLQLHVNRKNGLLWFRVCARARTSLAIQ